MNLKITTSKDLTKRLLKELLGMYDKLYIVIGIIWGISFGLSFETVNRELIIIIFAISLILGVILMVGIMKLFNVIISSIILIYSQHKFKTKYGLTNIYLDEKIYKEELDDYLLIIETNKFKYLQKHKDNFYIHTYKLSLLFTKEMFKTEDDFNVLLNKFEEILIDNKRKKHHRKTTN